MMNIFPKYKDLGYRGRHYYYRRKIYQNGKLTHNDICLYDTSPFLTKEQFIVMLLKWNNEGHGRFVYDYVREEEYTGNV